MKESLFTLVPQRVQYDQFWMEIRKRNRWLINLRYGASAMLFSLVIALSLVYRFTAHIYVNTLPLLIISSSILIYNLIFYKIWKIYPTLTEKFPRLNALHFSMLQISFDMIALMAFIYYTGGIESPLYAFFIFHIIIGSLILPGNIVCVIVSVLLSVTLTGSLLEAKGLIAHHAVSGLLQVSLYNNYVYMAIFFTVFAISLYLSIYLANSIAKQLYLREKSLTKAYFDLENAEKSKSRYVMTVVHDLKTPIAAATSHINNLLGGIFGDIPEDQQRPLERSKARLDNAIQTINDILQISQIKLETDIDNVEDIDLSALFEDIYSEMTELILGKNLDYSFKSELAPDTKLEANYKIMKLALANIISNSVKYTNQGGKIEIIIKEDSGMIEISVADSGIGIPESEQGKIFQEFFRSSVSKRKNIEGTGLGMSIVLQIIKRYNGLIRVISPCYLAMNEDCPGSQFVVTLPLLYTLSDQTN